MPTPYSPESETLDQYADRAFVAGTRTARPEGADKLLWRAACLRSARRRVYRSEHRADTVTIQIAVSQEEYTRLQELRLAQKGSPEEFFHRSLIHGAKFLANTSQGKIKPATNKG